MSLLQKYRKEETKKTTPEEEKELADSNKKKEKVERDEKEIPKTTKTKKQRKQTSQGNRSRPVISATVNIDLVEALNDLTDEKYINRSKFIEDAVMRVIKAEFPEIAKRYNF
jgi:hypothetical protein